MSGQEASKSSLPTFIPPKTYQSVQLVRPREHEATYHHHDEAPHIDPYSHRHDQSANINPSSHVQARPDTAPLGVFQSFITKKPESIVLKQSILSLTGDSFRVETLDSRGVLQIKGRILSLSGRKSIIDMQGNHVFDIRKKHTAILPSFCAESPHGKTFFKAIGKFTSMQ